MAPRDNNNNNNNKSGTPSPSSSSKPQRSSRHSPQSSDARRRRPAAPSAVVPADVRTQSPPAQPVSAGRLHYLPPLPSMNPNYPAHHSPYIQQQHYPHPHHPLSGPGPVGTNGAPIPGMYPYGMPPHPPPPPYAHHPYGYHQYGPMGPGGFPPPRPPDVPQQSPPPSTPTPSTPAPGKGVKRKRKSEDRTKSEEDGDNADLKKRTKTQRACDSCRSRKIRYIPSPFLSPGVTHFLIYRCDVLPDIDPPQCQHCKQYGFDCTFFLPITETRFKKKRLEEEAAAAAAAATSDKPEKPDRPVGTAKSDPLARAETKVLGECRSISIVHDSRARKVPQVRPFYCTLLPLSQPAHMKTLTCVIITLGRSANPATALSRSQNLLLEILHLAFLDQSKSVLSVMSWNVSSIAILMTWPPCLPSYLATSFCPPPPHNLYSSMPSAQWQPLAVMCLLPSLTTCVTPSRQSSRQRMSSVQPRRSICRPFWFWECAPIVTRSLSRMHSRPFG